MAKINLNVNGKDIAGRFNEKELEVIKNALLTSNIDSSAWERLTAGVNPAVLDAFRMANPALEMVVIVDEKTRTSGLTVGKFAAKLEAAIKASEWAYDIISPKGEKIAKESGQETDVTALLADLG